MLPKLALGKQHWKQNKNLQNEARGGMGGGTWTNIERAKQGIDILQRTAAIVIRTYSKDVVCFCNLSIRRLFH